MASVARKTKEGRCRIHGLAADKDGLCIRCRKEQQTQKGKKLLYWVGGGAAIVGVLVILVFLQVGRRPNDETLATEPVAVPNQAAAPPEQPAAKAPPAAEAPRRTQDDQAKAVERARRRVEITMYMEKSHPACQKAQQWLRDNRVRYRARDVERSESAKRTLLEKNPAGSVPTFVIDEEVLVGFSEGALKSRIDWAAMIRTRED